MFNIAEFFLIFSLIIILTGFFIVYKFRITSLTRFKLLLSYLAGISLLLVIYNIYINFTFNERVEKNRISYNTIENVQNNYLDPQKQLLANYPEGFFLYASMNKDADLKNFEPKQYDPVKRKQTELYISLRVFQSVEDFLSVGSYDLTGQFIWINVFLTWMQSSILQHYWSTFGQLYSQDTRELVLKIIEGSNFLIKLREQKGKLTAKDYDNISTKFKIKYR